MSINGTENWRKGVKEASNAATSKTPFLPTIGVSSLVLSKRFRS